MCTQLVTSTPRGAALCPCSDLRERLLCDTRKSRPVRTCHYKWTLPAWSSRWLVKILDGFRQAVLVLFAVIAHFSNSFLYILGSAGVVISPSAWCSPVWLLLLLSATVSLSDACSTRPSPKPRPPRPYWQPNLNLPRYNCTEDYAKLYCLNNGTCYMQMNVNNEVTPYCECSPGHFGRRCEYQDFADRFAPIIRRERIETAAISAAVTCLVIVAFFVTLAVYVYRRRAKFPVEFVDSESIPDRPFALRRRDGIALRTLPVQHDEEACGPTTSGEARAAWAAPEIDSDGTEPPEPMSRASAV